MLERHMFVRMHACIHAVHVHGTYLSTVYRNVHIHGQTDATDMCAGLLLLT